MPFCILIPTINRKDLLDEALDYYAIHYPKTNIYILDNGNQGIEKRNAYMRILRTPQPLGVAASWNYLIKYALVYNNANFLILNDDIILGKNQSDMDALIQKWGDECISIPRPFYHWSAFCFNKSVYFRIGAFDERFERAFFEDNDYAYRAKLEGIPIIHRDELNAEVFRNSQTIERNPKLGGYITNREYYIKKWGGLPNQEKYKIPFKKCD